MRRHNLLVRSWYILLPVYLMLLGTVTTVVATAGEPKVQRLIFVSAGFNESNPLEIIGRPQHLLLMSRTR